LRHREERKKKKSSPLGIGEIKSGNFPDHTDVRVRSLPNETGCRDSVAGVEKETTCKT